MNSTIRNLVLSKYQISLTDESWKPAICYPFEVQKKWCMMVAEDLEYLTNFCEYSKERESLRISKLYRDNKATFGEALNSAVNCQPPVFISIYYNSQARKSHYSTKKAAWYAVQCMFLAADASRINSRIAGVFDNAMMAFGQGFSDKNTAEAKRKKIQYTEWLIEELYKYEFLELELKYQIPTIDRDDWNFYDLMPSRIRCRQSWKYVTDIEHLTDIAKGCPDAEECIRIAKLYRDGEATMEELNTSWNNVPQGSSTASYNSITGEEPYKLYQDWVIEELCEYESTKENING